MQAPAFGGNRARTLLGDDVALLGHLLVEAREGAAAGTGLLLLHQVVLDAHPGRQGSGQRLATPGAEGSGSLRWGERENGRGFGALL